VWGSWSEGTSGRAVADGGSRLEEKFQHGERGADWWILPLRFIWLMLPACCSGRGAVATPVAAAAHSTLPEMRSYGDPTKTLSYILMITSIQAQSLNISSS